MIADHRIMRKYVSLPVILFAALGLAPATHERLRGETEREVRQKLGPLLMEYCKDSCVLIDVKVEVDEALGEGEDLGFEGVSGDDSGANTFVSKVEVDVQVDDRVSAVNRDRLASVLRNNLSSIGGAGVDVVFKPVTLPQIGQSAALEEQLKRQLQLRMTQAVDKVIETYCPDECVLSSVAVDGKLVTPDEAAQLAPENQLRDKSGNAILKIEGVDVNVAADGALPAETRNRIASVLKARTRFAAPVEVVITATPFPESFAKKQERLNRQSKDPFGLEQLRQTLRIFKELAGTKEVITTSKSDSTQEKSSASNSNSSSKAGEETSTTELLVGAGLIAALLVLVVLAMRFAGASREARIMVETAGKAAPRAESEAAAGGGKASGVSDEARKDMSVRMRVEDLRDELVRGFVDSPRVAKETFSRLLQEEGIEDTARYVHIFGHLVVFELLGDPNLQRDLFELSEYYHKSEFNFSPEEELKLLTGLRTRVTANEIRVLTRKQMDRFDFLLKLDATQIYNLIAEEKPQVQSIVLTQLDHKRRRAVFDMYQGEAKVALMRELCRADAIPKEYLSNVAKALHKKVSTRPEFDTEHLRSSDILLDLLEKAALDEQRSLMQNLVETNADAARGIKLRLVTVEIMPYLRDGHLLEIMLGMEREDLVTFLAGTREHIRNLVLSKAPDELADTWIEELENVKALDEQAYRLVEMKVLGRIRALANTGVINLLDVNDMIFGKADDAPETRAA
jgi:flagellar motor switch protein FliG